MTKDIKIGLFGFGCVGQGLYDVLNNSKGISASIEKFVVKHRDKPRPLPQELFSYDANEVLFDPEINLIVELIDNAEEAYYIVTTALKNGKDVVTANKKLVAEHLEELVKIQQEYGTSLLYEASSCGSIPIIRTLEEYYDNETLFSVSGIFNGSSNYILSKVFDEGSSYEDALTQAQQLGFAESDPTLDVGGFDAKYKLIILACHSFGVMVKPEEVFNYGIQHLNPHDMRYAREKGLKIKQIAQVRKVGENQLTLYVMPVFVSRESYFYQVNNEYNGVAVEAAFSEKQFFRGKGAGGHPTGSAVLSDISANRYDYKYEYRKKQRNNELQVTNEVELTVYFRFEEHRQLDENQFIEIFEKHESKELNYVIGKVLLSSLMSNPYFKQENSFIAEVSA